MYNTYDEAFLLDGLSIETVHGLEAHLEPGGGNWIGVGKFLHEQFAGSDVTISVGAAGAIPYYSELRTIDPYGLNDAWVARNGIWVGTRPGHSWVAPLSYLVSSRVNLALWWKPQAGEVPPPEARWVEIPVGGAVVTALYLTKSAAVDDAIRSGGWKTTAAAP